jgi:hypothetical protein
LQSLLQTARHYPPVNLDPNEPVALMLYRVRENTLAAANGTAQPYIVFTTGHMPPLSDGGRYGVNRWNYFQFV